MDINQVLRAFSDAYASPRSLGLRIVYDLCGDVLDVIDWDRSTEIATIWDSELTNGVGVWDFSEGSVTYVVTGYSVSRRLAGIRIVLKAGDPIWPEDE